MVVLTKQLHYEMSFNRIDIHSLVAFLEKELQSRDARISELKSEKSLEQLCSSKYNQLGFSDTDNSGKGRDKSAGVKTDPIIQLEDLIATQHKAQSKLKEQIKLLLEKHGMVNTEIELKRITHENAIEINAKAAIFLMQEREQLIKELQEMKLKREQLEADPRKLGEKIQHPKRHRTVVDKLVKRRKEIIEELRTDCHKCVQLESLVEEAKDRVLNLEIRLESTKKEISKAIDNISRPFYEQVATTTTEFAILKSKIENITSSNDQLRIKIGHLNEEEGNCKNKASLHKTKVHSLKVMNGSDENYNLDSCLSVSPNFHNSILDSFDSTIKMLEKEIESSNLLRHPNKKHMNTPSKFRISAPHPTPNRTPINLTNHRISQKITNFESLMNSNNAAGQTERPKSSNSSLNFIPSNSFGSSKSNLNLPAAVTSNIVTFNDRASSTFNHPAMQSKVPAAPPSSLSSSPVVKRLPSSPTSRGKHPPPLPSKPQVNSSKSSQTQANVVPTVKHLIMPPKMLS